MHDQFCDGRYGLQCICERLADARADERLLIIDRINRFRMPTEPPNSTWNAILDLVESRIRSGQ